MKCTCSTYHRLDYYLNEAMGYLVPGSSYKFGQNLFISQHRCQFRIKLLNKGGPPIV